MFTLEIGPSCEATRYYDDDALNET